MVVALRAHKQPHRTIFSAVAALATLAFAYFVARPFVQAGTFHLDFDLYYFGAVAEKHGSYTNDHEVWRLAAGHQVFASGVFGAPTLIGFIFMPLTLLGLEWAGHLWDLTTMI